MIKFGEKKEGVGAAIIIGKKAIGKPDVEYQWIWFKKLSFEEQAAWVVKHPGMTVSMLKYLASKTKYL